MNTYGRQSRGDTSDYERYLAGMDASMQQKVALTAAHLIGEGRLADMGMGSGTGSEALAALYPNLRVTGVDINPQMVALAAQRYRLPNLDFLEGDIAGRCFPPETLDVVFNSSVLHHVTTFNGYRPAEAARAIANQVAQLKVGGNLIIRDFLKPEPGVVVLEMSPEWETVFLRFAREWRALLPADQRGVSFEALEPAADGWLRFRLEHTHAVEFVLRKDYQADWDTEILEEYTYFTQQQFEKTLTECRMRILTSTPIRNPWIVKHRFEGKIRLKDIRGKALEHPPTNYLVVAEKVAPSSGVGFRVGESALPAHYLQMSHYRHRQSGALRDLVRRPNATLDVVPYFVQNNELYVLARRSYPRPLLQLCRPTLDQSRAPAYVTEPFVVIQSDKPLAQTVEEALLERTGIATEHLLKFHLGGTTYPSPGGLQEEVRAVFVEIDPVARSADREQLIALSARQLLRSAQVGGLPDSRLELHSFELLSSLGRDAGPWIGEQLALHAHPAPPPGALTSLPESAPRRAFVPAARSADFLVAKSVEFEEFTAAGEVLERTRLDYVRPRKLSLSTVSAVLLWRTSDNCYMAVDDDDFPAAQCFCGHSNLWVNPAWRLPEEVSNLTTMEHRLRNIVASQHGLKLGQIFTLGGPYFPSAGATPEVVYPVACEVLEIEPGGEPLHWVSLGGLLAHFEQLKDGHLKTALLRVARALNLHS